ncbi:RNA-directed DNA polymerase from mobile element jockey [Cyphomyrmex costatus]|uniref:RNA-directed DNA polymerase from mobile element jockey n=1 Tax=Cyphomyrmex costatus TaxID=456900 RepID=A0A151IDI4_9HYME|nr:RNA-directed DNA polymerase from mobile element jockey [Cyphomyrmex costatus]
MRTGVKNVLVDISEKTILKEFSSQAKISSARRLQRRVKRDGKDELLPSLSVLVKFQGQFLPRAISYHFYIGVYRHPNLPFSKNIFNSLHCFLSQFPSLILIGDFNAHHSLWGSPRSNSAGSALCDLVETLDLCCLNPDSTPTFFPHPSRSPSTIDLTFSSSDLHGSDHSPISLFVRKKIKFVNLFSNKFRLSRRQWISVAALLEDRARAISEDSSAASLSISPDEGYQVFVKGIMSCIKDFIPTNNKNKHHIANSKGRSPRSPPPALWWTPECDEAIRDRSTFLKNFKNAPTPENYALYQASVRTTRKFLRSVKRKRWKEFCEKLDALTPTADLWKMLKRFKDRRLASGGSVSSGGNHESDQILQATIHQICPSSCSPPIPASSDNVNNALLWLDQPFSLNEIEAALSAVKVSSSPSLDRVEYRLLKLLPTNLLSCLLFIFNIFYSSSYFLFQWFHSIIHFVPKPHGKGF